MSFVGFSEDEINKLKKVQTQKLSQSSGDRTLNENTDVPFQLANRTKPKPKLKKPNQNILTEKEFSSDKGSEPSPTEYPNNKVNSNLEQDNKKNGNIPAHTKINIEDFEQRQKLIEEQNRKRKELLAKALAAKRKQTQEEAQRLYEIEQEFKKLDAILSNDVKILRKQIDTACLEYMEAQKKYDKIEKEYLAAKLLMFQKLEKKEMLTEHLYAIIDKNEERKAQKLTELLEKLNICQEINKFSDIDVTDVQNSVVSSTS